MMICERGQLPVRLRYTNTRGQGSWNVLIKYLRALRGEMILSLCARQVPLISRSQFRVRRSLFRAHRSEEIRISLRGPRGKTSPLPPPETATRPRLCSVAACLQRCTGRLRYGLNVADELPTLRNAWSLASSAIFASLREHDFSHSAFRDPRSAFGVFRSAFIVPRSAFPFVFFVSFVVR